VTGSHQYGGDGPYTVTVSVNDGSGVGSGSLQVTDAPPVVTPGSDLSGNEGSPVSLSASFSDLGFDYNGATKSFTATIDWGDGTSSAGSVDVTPGDATTPTAGTINASHVYTTFGTFHAVLRLADEAKVEGDGYLDAVIGNVAPSVAPLQPGSFSPNKDFTLSGAFMDAGLGDTHSVTIDWGDGSTITFDGNTHFLDANGNPLVALVEPTATAPGQFSLARAYSDTLDHTITVTVTDNGGLSAQTSATYYARADVTSFTPPAATESVPFSGPVLTFADPQRMASDLSATIQWGDGKSSTGTAADGGIVQNADGSFTVQASHTYAEEATGLTFSVQVQLTNGVVLCSDSGSIDVADAPLTAGKLTPPVATEGVAVSGAVLFHFSDANPGATPDDFTAAVTWGDGSVETSAANPTAVSVVANANGGFDVVGTHTFAEEATGLAFGVSVADHGASPVGASASIDVADAALTAGKLTPPVATEGIAVTGVLFHFGDADPGATPDDFTAAVTWGDGSVQDSITNPADVQVVASAAGGFDVVGTHTYLTATSPTASAGTLSLGVRVHDVGGSFAEGTAPVAVSGDVVIHGTTGNDGPATSLAKNSPAVRRWILAGVRHFGKEGAALGFDQPGGGRGRCGSPTAPAAVTPAGTCRRRGSRAGRWRRRGGLPVHRPVRPRPVRRGHARRDGGRRSRGRAPGRDARQRRGVCGREARRQWGRTTILPPSSGPRTMPYRRALGRAPGGRPGRTWLSRVASRTFNSYSANGMPRQTRLPPPKGNHSCGPNFRSRKRSGRNASASG
jgi:hypothetical protein